MGTVRDGGRGAAFPSWLDARSRPARRSVVALLAAFWLLVWSFGLLIALAWVGDDGLDRPVPSPPGDDRRYPRRRPGPLLAAAPTSEAAAAPVPEPAPLDPACLPPAT